MKATCGIEGLQVRMVGVVAVAGEEGHNLFEVGGGG